MNATKQIEKLKKNTGRTFRLIGCTLPFKAIDFDLAAGFIPRVFGISEDGRWTVPRVADILWLD